MGCLEGAIDLIFAARAYKRNTNPTKAKDQIWLGFKYEKGKEGVQKDMEKAIYWYTRAAEQGSTDAYVHLGMCFDGEDTPKDIKKAIYWFTKAAEQGDADGQFALGTYYQNGEGVPKDIEKAIYWFTKAANQGNEYAQSTLNDLQRQGRR